MILPLSLLISEPSPLYTDHYVHLYTCIEYWYLLVSFQLCYDFPLLSLLISEPSPLATTATVMDSTASPAPTGEVKGHNEKEMDDEEDNKDDHSLVEVYADRLCAVTHAFALCCSTLQKNSGR